MYFLIWTDNSKGSARFWAWKEPTYIYENRPSFMCSSSARSVKRCLLVLPGILVMMNIDPKSSFQKDITIKEWDCMYECWRMAPHVYLLEISDERGALGRNERNREYHYFTSCKCLCRKFKVPAGHWQAWTLSELRCINHFSCAFLKKGFFIFRKNGWTHERVPVARFCRGCGIIGKKVFFSFLERRLLDEWVFGFCRCAQLVCADIYTEATAVRHITALFALFSVVLFSTYHFTCIYGIITQKWKCSHYPNPHMFPAPHLLFHYILWNGLNKEAPSIVQELGPHSSISCPLIGPGHNTVPGSVWVNCAGV